MNVLLNASNLRHGGGKTVAVQLINAIAPLRPNDTFYVIAPQAEGFEQLKLHNNIIVLPLPKSFHYSGFSKLWQQHFVFPSYCKKLKIDKIVSLGNVAFPAKGTPQLVYIQLPQLVYEDSPAWKKMDISTRIFNKKMVRYVSYHLRYATSFAVQTEVMKARLIKRFRLSERNIYMLPNAPIEIEMHEIIPLKLPLQKLRLLFLSRYYSHKSFEVLPTLAKLIKERKLPVEITITISAEESAGAAKVLQALSQYQNIINNIGPIEIDKVGDIVKGHDGIFLPSLMESYSGAYAEAVLHHRLIFTSNFDFATDLLGDAAFYFDPLNAAEIVKSFEAALKDEETVSQKLSAIEKLASTMPRIQKVSQIFSQIIDTFA